MDLMEKLKTHVSGILNVSEDDLVKISYGEGSWDSLAHMNIITMLEEVFEIELEEDEMIEITSLNAIFNVLNRKID